MKRSRLATYAMGMAVAVTMTGCGDSFADEPTKDVVAAAAKAMGDLESVHIDADITTDGTEVVMDLSLSTAGNCEGSVALNGGGLEVLRVDGDGWFKADDAFWETQAPEQAAQIIELTGGKWVVDTTGEYTSFCDLEGFLDEIATPDDDEDYEKDGTAEVDGDDAVKIKSDDSTTYVATDEPHHILKVEGSGDDDGEATFSEFDEDVEVEAPSDDEVIDLEQLG